MATFLHLTACLPFHSIILFSQIKMPSQKRDKSHPQQHNSVLRTGLQFSIKFWLAAGNLFEAHKQFTQLTLLPVWVRQLHLLTITPIRDAFACSVVACLWSCSDLTFDLLHVYTALQPGSIRNHAWHWHAHAGIIELETGNGRQTFKYKPRRWSFEDSKMIGS